MERFDPDFTPNTTDLPGRRYCFRWVTVPAPMHSFDCSPAAASHGHVEFGWSLVVMHGCLTGAAWCWQLWLCSLQRPFQAALLLLPEIRQWNLVQLATPHHRNHSLTVFKPVACSRLNHAGTSRRLGSGTWCSWRGP